MKTPRNIIVVALTVLIVSTVTWGDVSPAQRRIAVGATTPHFSVVDTTGALFTYAPSSGKVLLLTFLSSPQERSQKAVEDILDVLSGVPADKRADLQVALVMEHAHDREWVRSIQKEIAPGIQILIDKHYTLWGKFGVIATPTVLISDARGKVCCAKAGQAYDVAPVIKSQLYQALKIPCAISAEGASTVHIAANGGISARAKRHLEMAKMLLEKDRISSAIEQAQMAFEIDPSSTGVALELGELLCRAGQSQKAIKLVRHLSSHSEQGKARINLTLGWANRQLGKLDQAEAFLQDGVKQDPTSPRLYFELGRIYQSRNDAEQAMTAYARALQLIYREK
jgi:tetratricopeptide (TPR) repeat protein